METILSSIAPDLNTENLSSADHLAEQMLIQSILGFPDSLADFELEVDLFKQEYYRIIFNIVNEVRLESAPMTLTYLKVKYQKYFENPAFDEFFAEMWRYRDIKLNPHLKFYVDVLMKRQMKEKFEQLKWRSSHESLPVEEQVTTLVDRAQNLLNQYVPPPQASFNSILSAVIDKAELAAKGEMPFCIKTHYEALDRVLEQGILEDYLVILGGLPGTGKTTFALNLAKNVARYQKHSVMFISLEMGAERVMQWYMSACTGISLSAYQRGELTDKDYSMIMWALKEMCDNPLDLQTSGSDITNVLRSIRNGVKHNPNCKLIIVDHLHFITYSKATNPTEVISRATGSLKQLAKELKIPIILLSQLLKPTPEMIQTIPHVGMLKGSGSIVSDADLIMILKHNTTQRPMDGSRVIDNYILKNRGGAAGLDPVPFLHYGKCAQIRG